MKLTDLGQGNRIEGNAKESIAFNVTFKGSNSTLIIGEDVTFKNCNIYLHNNSYIYIGQGSYIRGSFLSHDNCNITIGSYLRCNSYLNISTAEKTNVKIGNDCLVAQSTIRTSDMHPIFDLDTNVRINKAADVTIGNHVWLAQDSFIGKNSLIPDGSVVGALSVVTKKYYQKNIIIAGNPARVIKKNIHWEKNLNFKPGEKNGNKHQ